MTGTGGSTGSGGKGGTTGTGGSTGSTGSGGTTGTGGAGGAAAPTFTQVYTQVLVPNCSEAQCHNPGAQTGYRVRDPVGCLHLDKEPGDTGERRQFQPLQVGQRWVDATGRTETVGRQPRALKAWIDAGALNN